MQTCHENEIEKENWMLRRSPPARRSDFLFWSRAMRFFFFGSSPIWFRAGTGTGGWRNCWKCMDIELKLARRQMNVDEYVLKNIFEKHIWKCVWRCTWKYTIRQRRERNRRPRISLWRPFRRFLPSMTHWGHCRTWKVWPGQRRLGSWKRKAKGVHV